MCMCEQRPTINGEPGYSWDGKHIGVYPLSPPDLADCDELLYDEPGRCGGLDAHSHHFRMVKSRSTRFLLVRHGGGDERIELGCVARIGLSKDLLDTMDSNARFWLFHTLYSVHRDSANEARMKERRLWMTAAAEKRIKTRKSRAGVKVEIVTA